MKKTFLLLIIIIICIKLNAQNFEHNYLGKDFLLYKGALFKLKDDAISGFNHTFYADLKNCQSSFDDNVIYPEKQYYFKTTKDSLTNRIFIVENIIDKSGKSLDNSSTEKPIFILKDSISKKMIYFKYDEEYEHNFCFNTSKIKYDESNFCSKVERQVDDFTGEITISSPRITGGKLSPIIIYKYVKKGKPTLYYLGLRTYGSTVNVYEKGVTILFDDGTKWYKQSKIDVQADNNGFEYSAFILLNASDLLTFTTKKIKKFRLYIYDGAINTSDADKFNLFIKCVKTTNQ
jgi:hypothetical protein